MLVTDKTVAYGTHKDPLLIARDGVALTLATEASVDKIMTDLEQSQKKVTQLKETLKKERSESQSLKRKYEDMIGEFKVSKAECQNLQAEKYALVISARSIEKNS